MKTLFYGGKILTMSSPLYADALLTEDGKILSVGREEELRRIPDIDEEIFLNGSVLLPGLIDPHSHFFHAAMSLLQVSLEGCSSAGEIQHRIDAFLRDNPLPDGGWITARGYDQNRMPGGKHLSLAAVDALCPDHPLVIYHKSGHMGLLNTPALEQVGIRPDTPAPEGGRIGLENGQLTGYLEENAFFEAVGRVPMPGLDQLLAACEQVQKKYASYGITTVQDGMVVADLLPMYEHILQRNLLHLDVVLYAAPDVYQKTKDLLAAYPENEHLHLGGMKLLLDGSPQGRTAWMREPYEGSADYCGYPTMTDEEVEAAMTYAAEEKTQILCHCNGDAAAEQFLRCLEHVEERMPEMKELRPVIIHGQLIGLDQLPRAAALGAMISFFAAHVYHWGDVHIRNFGHPRADHISPVRHALDAGVRVTFHQDSPVIEPDMLETLWCAVTRQTRNGILLGQEECVSILDALRAVTDEAAFQYFEEGRKGKLEPGMDADFVVMDQDPLLTADYNLRRIQILQTYKKGVCVYTK